MRFVVEGDGDKCQVLDTSYTPPFVTYIGTKDVAVRHADMLNEEEGLSYVGTCQSCGRYLDVRQHKWCPSPCNGYVG